jgi:hypothetical protein
MILPVQRRGLSRHPSIMPQTCRHFWIVFFVEWRHLVLECITAVRNRTQGSSSMQNEFDNPYAPTNVTGYSDSPVTALGIPEPDLKKAEAVVKDADQFWLAIILCFICSALGIILIGPWYLIRILQWQSLSSQYPILMDTNAPPKTLPYRFQRAKTKLIIGIAFGGMIVGGIILFLIFVSFASPVRR